MMHQKPHRLVPPRPTDDKTAAALWDCVYAVPPRPTHEPDARIWDLMHKWPKTDAGLAASQAFWRQAFRIWSDDDARTTR